MVCVCGSLVISKEISFEIKKSELEWLAMWSSQSQVYLDLFENINKNRLGKTTIVIKRICILYMNLISLIFFIESLMLRIRLNSASGSHSGLRETIHGLERTLFKNRVADLCQPRHRLMKPPIGEEKSRTPAWSSLLIGDNTTQFFPFPFWTTLSYVAHDT